MEQEEATVEEEEEVQEVPVEEEEEEVQEVPEEEEEVQKVAVEEKGEDDNDDELSEDEEEEVELVDLEPEEKDVVEVETPENTEMEVVEEGWTWREAPESASEFAIRSPDGTLSTSLKAAAGYMEFLGLSQEAINTAYSFMIEVQGGAE